MSLIPAFTRYNPNADHKTLAKALKNWKFEIEGYVGYERCVVTAGGVNLEEVVSKTLESRLVKGLYFAGEILDLDADTGGYNLQTAFSTGYLAGISAAKG
jgi:predicted flavoprotein YhiN